MTHNWCVKMHCDCAHDNELLLLLKDPQQAMCPICRAIRPRFTIIDVSALPHKLTQGHKWACDGCWTSWERNGILLDDGRRFNEAIMYELMGAPAAFVEEICKCTGHSTHGSNNDCKSHDL